MPEEEKLAAVRALLPATGAGIYLNTGTAGPLPSETAAAMRELAEWEVRTGRAHPGYEAETASRADAARGTVAAVLHGDVDSVALTHGTTHGLNIALWSIDWQPGDRLVTSDLEYPGVMAACRSLTDRRGVEVAIAGVDRTGDDDRTAEAFARTMEGRTRMVLCSHVAWSTGAVLPVDRIVRAAHDRGALAVIDGAQAAGAIPLDVSDLGPDFYAIPAQKWLLGPEGMGALYVAPQLGDRVRPAFAGFDGLADPADPRSPLVGTARRFEANAFYAPSVAGMARSCGWLAMYVGLNWITERGPALARAAAAALGATPGVEVVTPAARMGTLVTFRIRGWPSGLAVSELGARAFAITRHVGPLDAIRISLGFFNTAAEVERFCRAVAELAGHTPESLPARRLLVLGQE